MLLSFSHVELVCLPVHHLRLTKGDGALMFDAICQLYCVIYGGQFPQLEEQIVPGSEPATFRLQLPTTTYGIRTRIIGKQPVPLLTPLVLRGHGFKSVTLRLRGERIDHWAAAVQSDISRRISGILTMKTYVKNTNKFQLNHKLHKQTSF